MGDSDDGVHVRSDGEQSRELDGLGHVCEGEGDRRLYARREEERRQEVGEKSAGAESPLKGPGRRR